MLDLECLNRRGGEKSVCRQIVRNGIQILAGKLSSLHFVQEFRHSLAKMGKKTRGPKDKKKLRSRAKLKISSENEIFERATHRGPIFVGKSRRRD